MFCNKRPYKTKDQAVLTIHDIQNKPDGKRKPIRVYKCRCGKWHLTSKPIESDKRDDYQLKLDWGIVIKNQI